MSNSKSSGSKSAAWFVVIIIAVILAAFVSCVLGSSLWNNTIAGELEWTQPITAWQFFKMEVIFDCLIWFWSLGKTFSKSKD